MPKINSVKTYNYNPDIGIITARPNSTVIHQNPWVYSTITYNSLGFRGNNWDPDLIEDKLRVVLLGDSYIEGKEVEETELISSVLGGLLGNRDVVMNFGLSGSSQAEQLIIYKNLIRKLRPQIVIHFVTVSNDFEDNLIELSPRKSKNFLDIENDELVTVPLPMHARILCSKGISRLTEKITNLKVFRLVYSFLETKHQINGQQENNLDVGHAVTIEDIDRKKNENLQDIETRKEKRADRTLSQFMTPKYEKAKTVMEKALLLLKSECEKDGVHFILSHATAGWNFVHGGNEIHQMRSDKIMERYRWLEDFTNKHGVHFFDLQQSLIQHQQQENLDASDIHIPWDGHWTPLAHRLAAEKLYDYLNDTILSQIRIRNRKKTVEITH